MPVNMCKVPNARMLGQGTFGQVWEVESETSGEIVARKYFRHAKERDDEALWFTILQERFPQHPNIIRMLQSITDNGYAALDLELAHDGSLDDMAFHRDANNSQLTRCPTLATSAKVLAVVKGCLKALQFLHDANIAHNDIKPANILMKRGIAKLADFGACTLKNSVLSERVGSFEFMAPEIFANEQEDEGKTDVFSLGITFFVAFEGSYPTPPTEEFRRIWDRWCNANAGNRRERSDELRRVSKKFFSPACYSSRLMDGNNLQPGVLGSGIAHLVAEMIRVNCDRRPTAAQCLQLLERFNPTPIPTLANASVQAAASVRIASMQAAASVRALSIQAAVSAHVHDDDELARSGGHASGATPTYIEDEVVHVDRPAARVYNFQPILEEEVMGALETDTDTAPRVESEEDKMLRLARIFANGGTCEGDEELQTLLGKIRVKSNMKRNEFAYRLLDVMHKHREFECARQKIFERIVQPGKYWWDEHRKQRGELRAKYE